MNPERDDVCLLFQGSDAHPAHRVFADAVDAEYRHFETGRKADTDTDDTNRIIDRVRTARRLPRYDTVIAEGTAPLHTGLVYKSLHPGSTLLYLAADETFYTIGNRKSRYVWRLINPVVSTLLLDGVIAVGRDVYEWGRPYVGDVPVRYVHPPIADEKYRALSDLDAASPQEPFVVLSAGVAKPANGYDLLSAAVERIAEQASAEVHLVILGSGHVEQRYGRGDHVTTPGYVELTEFSEWFGRASVYVQSSIGDSFPVAALEGILSGTPTVVTESTGVRELLPSELVSPPSVTGLSSTIEELHEMDEDNRTEIGRKNREVAKGLTERNQRWRFRNAVRELS